MSERFITEVTPEYLRPRLLGRENDSHKGDYGHLLIVAGCRQMPGAAVLSTGAALKSGCGLVTLHSTERALQAVVDNFPSAMLSEDSDDVFSEPPAHLDRYSALSVGPGLGQSPKTMNALMDLLDEACEKRIPAVLDADALNILSTLPDWQKRVPPGSVLTPHRMEYRRLFHADPDDGTQRLSEQLQSVIVSKGYGTRIYTPDGVLHNTTGGPGLAKGGSGDVLTGLVGGLLARGYKAADAAALGVWVHGFAGDVLSEECTGEAFNSRDLVDALPRGFFRLYR